MCRDRAMTKVLLTGGIGSGKSLAAAFFSSLGAFVYDSDSAVKRLYVEDHGLRTALAARFGDRVLVPGGVNKDALAEVVFGTAGDREALEAIVHPVVKEDFARAAQASGAEIAIMESAIAGSKKLFDGFFDKTVLIDAPIEIRLLRCCTRDGATKEEVLWRIAAQELPSTADYTVCNDGNQQQLRDKLQIVWNKLNNR